MTYTIIVAMGSNGEIGINGDLAFKGLKADLKFFKEQTMHHKVIMGSNTYLSLPPTKLPGRDIHVLSRNNNFSEVTTHNSLEALQKWMKKNTETNEEVFICGGASIYKLFLPIASRLLITKINASNNLADTFFPKFEKTDYYEPKILGEVNDNDLEYKFLEYKRIH